MTLAIIGALGLLAFIAVAYFRGVSAGKSAVKAQVGEQNVKAAERIAESRKDAPVDLAALRERLRAGGKL